MTIFDFTEDLAPYDLLHHQFYKAWSEGKLSIADLQFYAKQYYHHVLAFPRYLSRLHSVCESLTQRQVLLANLVDEESGPDNHPELWLRFAEGVGVDRSSILSCQLNIETKLLIDGYHELAASYPRGLGALYAYERQIPAVAKSKIEGLCEFYNISDERSLQFFTAHITADEWHSQECSELISLLNPADLEEARSGAIAGAKLLWQFLDGIPHGACSTAN